MEQLADPDTVLVMTTNSGYIISYQLSTTAGLLGWSLPKGTLSTDRALGSGAMQGVACALALRSTEAAPRPAAAP